MSIYLGDRSRNDKLKNDKPETMNFIMRIIVTSVIAFGLSYILKG
jgi:hypothetical protein